MAHIQQHHYRIVLLCEHTSQAKDIEAFLTQQHQTVFHIASPDQIHHTVTTTSSDVLVVITSIPDAYLITHIKNLTLPVIIFSNDARREKIREAIQAGVASYVVDGLDTPRVLPIIEAALSRFHETSKLKQELENTKKDLAERKLIDRAKGYVMDQRNCTENEAYRILRKMAMDRKKKLGDVAKDIIEHSKALPA